MTTITGITKDAGGNILGGVEIRFELAKPAAQSNGDVNLRSISATSDSTTGAFSISVAPGKYDVIIDGDKVRNDVTIPDSETYTLNQVITL